MRQPAAAIDFGTNTARLLIGYPAPDGSIAPVLVKRWITRLGGGFTAERGISDEARERSLAALIDFAGEIRTHGVTRVRAVATSAVRDAVNGREFCADMLRKTGICLEVIDGRMEGILTLKGVLAGMADRSGAFLVFDIGGGSTEYTLALDREPLFTVSLPLGVVRLTEGKGEPAAMKEKIMRELTLFEDDLTSGDYSGLLARSILVGTAGTATTLAAISMKMADYDYRRVNNYSLPLQEIRDIYGTLLPLPPDERLRIPGLEKGREDLIIAGMLITLQTMEMFGFGTLRVSDFGLLEGLFLET